MHRAKQESIAISAGVVRLICPPPHTAATNCAGGVFQAVDGVSMYELQQLMLSSAIDDATMVYTDDFTVPMRFDRKQLLTFDRKQLSYRFPVAIPHLCTVGIH